ncbi:MAG TPA: hypothetical protein VIJ23_07810 [Mycobacterium sp.]
MSATDQASVEAPAAAGSLYQGARPAGRAMPGPAPSMALLRRFPPRAATADWPATGAPRAQLMIRLMADPFLGGPATGLQNRRRGLTRILDWLERQPGDTWQDRWLASAADAHGNQAWRRLPMHEQLEIDDGAGDSEHVGLNIARAMSVLVCADVLRPSLSWLLTPATPAGLVADLTRVRDPQGFARLAEIGRADGSSMHTTQLALRRIAAILAAKGGRVGDITVGDCLQLLHTLEEHQAGRGARSPYFYQLLHTAGVFSADAPTVRGLRTQGQLSCEQLIDRYGILCRPMRDLLVAYLRERQPGVDYATLHKMSYSLGRLFWRDLEIHHPGIDSLRLPADVATGWKERITTKITRVADRDGRITEVPRRGSTPWTTCSPSARSTSTSPTGRPRTRPGGVPGSRPAPSASRKPRCTARNDRTANHGWTSGPGNGCRSCPSSSAP